MIEHYNLFKISVYHKEQKIDPPQHESSKETPPPPSDQTTEKKDMGTQCLAQHTDHQVKGNYKSQGTNTEQNQSLDTNNQYETSTNAQKHIPHTQSQRTIKITDNIGSLAKNHQDLQSNKINHAIAINEATLDTEGPTPNPNVYISEFEEGEIVEGDITEKTQPFITPLADSAKSLSKPLTQAIFPQIGHLLQIAHHI